MQNPTTNSSSSISTPIPCGSPTKYCPQNSKVPIQVDDGYYSTGGLTPNTRTDQTIAPKGHYASSGEIFKCPAGTFGNVTGLSFNKNQLCSGKCHGGYYCPPGSKSDKEIPCGRYQFCPTGSAFPLFVRHGFYTTINQQNQSDSFESQTFIKPLTHQEQEHECEKGYFCDKAVRYKCFAGTYGNRVRETSSNCTGLCEAGYYCRPGSTSSRQATCGNPFYYCPRGSKIPLVVQPGYYTLNDQDEQFDKKTKQLICPKGKNTSLLKDYTVYMYIYI